MKTLKAILNGFKPKTAVVIGSGLGSLTNSIKITQQEEYKKITGFNVGGVSGHKNKIVAGYIKKHPVIMLSGRSHYYEQKKSDAMRKPIQELKKNGVKQIILTNSAGSLKKNMPTGSVMMITDHINFAGTNPLIGEKSEKRFVGLTNAYNKNLQKKFSDVARKQKTKLHKGVYMWFSGPSFETPAEINAAKILGADAVGMSTVPETILARFFGLDVAAFSVITNYAAGMTGDELSHDETKQNAPKGGEILAKLIEETLGGDS